MAIVISDLLTIEAPNNPVIGYDNLLTSSNVTTTTEDASHPAAYLANPSTALYWLGEETSPSSDEYITIALETEQLVDYVAIARHNFGTAEIEVSVEVLGGSPETWDEIVSGAVPSDDTPLVFRIEPQAIRSVRIRLLPGLEAPRAAVIYTGTLLTLQRRIYVGHTPITLGRKSDVVTGMSESGNFLGRIILNETNETSFSLENLTPDWYRTYFDPFVEAAISKPFFVAWRPDSYPNEVGFVWCTDDIAPDNSAPNGMMSVGFKVRGVV